MCKTLFIDFETFLDSKAGYSLSKVSLTGYIRSDAFAVHGFGYRWSHEDVTHWVSGEHTVWAWISAQNWSDTTVVSHNIKFDGSILAWRFNVKPQRWFDTVGLAKAVLGNHVSSYSLKAIADHLHLPPKGELKVDGKKVGELTHAEETELAQYCKNDVEICKGIYDRLSVYFPMSQLSAMDWTIRCFVEPRLLLDVQTLQTGVKNEKERREEIIRKSGVDRKVLTSNQQFAELLRGRGYVVPTKTSKTTGKETFALAKTDEGLSALMEVAPELYQARIAAKANLLETRGASLLDVARSGATFPFDVGFSGAVQTHRYSGGGGAGGNPQNFTRGSFLRSAVVAPTGFSLVVGDFAAIELRILAFLAREPKLIDSLVNDRDVYSEFASVVYKRPITKADKVERQFGKAAILGLGYGMGAKKFKDTVKSQLKQEITQKYAYDTVNLYRSTYSGVPRLWGFADQLLPLIRTGSISRLHFAPFLRVQKGSIVLPSGLKLQYPNLRQDSEGDYVYDVYDTATKTTPHKLYGAKLIENICQALAGEICKEAIAYCEEEGLVCVGTVHDEIIAVSEWPVRDEMIMKICMQRSPKWFPMLKLKAEVHNGHNWSDAK